MVKAPALFALLCVCSAGRPQESSDLSSLVFWPQPLANGAPALGARDGGARRSLTRPSRLPDADFNQPRGNQPRGNQPRGNQPSGNQPSGNELDATRATLSKAVEEHLDSLSEEESLNGERSPALIDELTAVAALYQKLGKHDAAVAALEDAIQITRINNGLYSLDQVAAVEAIVTSRLAQKDYEQANDQRDYIRDLVRRNPDDPRIVGVLSGLADSEMNAARRLVDVPAPPEINIRFSATPAISDFSAPKSRPQRPGLVALYAARRDYRAAISAAVRTHAGNTEDLFALEQGLIGTVYFQLRHPELYGAALSSASGRKSDTPLFFVGQGILQAKVTNTVSFRQTPIPIAKALVELGDWLLLFNENGAALDRYRTAHDALVGQSVPGEAIDELLSPEIPAILPVFPSGIADTGPDRARGYVDAAVDINRFGGVKRVKILDESSGTSKVIEKRLEAYVYRSRFRPRFVGGELARSDHFAARFCYAY